ncbi:MAG TPA: tetratricopeptide repeat protein [Actinocrinis sp.]|nr:tetratricopeptide repeat protein [Actinocrinis sp.]
MEFRLLGDLQVRHDGRRIDLGGRRRQCVLAVLLLHPGQLVATEKILGCAWPAGPPPLAADLVARYVAQLRRILEPAGGIRIRHRGTGYLAVVDPAVIDTHQFGLLIHQAYVDRADDQPDLAAAHLRQALGLWRGLPFADLDSPWLRDRGRALEAIRLDALEELARIDLEYAHPRGVVALLREPHAEHPERARLAALLIRALHAAGEPVQAAQTAERAVHTLRELGLDPGPLLRQNPGAPVGLAAPHFVPRSDPAAGPRDQLPAITAAFTGRTAEFRHVVDLAEAAFRSPRAKTVVICGVGADGAAVESGSTGWSGGIGKTALALHAARRVAGLFPDGRLYVDLRGHTPGLEPLTAAEALEFLLRSLGTPPRLIPRRVDDRAAVLRERLMETRTLIVLDNASSAEQVRPLLPSAGGCLALVTSREPLNDLGDSHDPCGPLDAHEKYDVYEVELDVLPQADAVALFRTVAGAARVSADDPAAVAIVDQCGGLPLAVRLAAALLRDEDAPSTQDLAAQLHDDLRGRPGPDGGERRLAAVFDLSYARLPAACRDMFRRLNLLPGLDFDAFAVANLTDTDHDVAGDILGSLAARELLLKPAPGRYRFHDLLRSRVATGTDADTAAAGRMLDFYQYTVIRADARIARQSRAAPDGPLPTYAPYLAGPDQARTWLRAERANLLACVSRAIAESDDARVVAFTRGLATLLRTDGPWPLAVSLHSAAAACAERLGDGRAQADALIDLGSTRRLTGDLAAAIRDLEAALVLCRGLDDRRARTDALVELGAARLWIGAYAEAARDLGEALELCREAGDRRAQAHALTQLGSVRKLAGDLPAAARDLQEALELCRDLGHQPGRTDALNHLGTVRRLTGDYPGATRDFEEALEVCREFGDRRGESEALKQLGDMRLLAGDFAGATRDYEESLEISGSLGHLDGEGAALGSLGTVRRLTGDLPGAVRTMGRALAVFRRIGAQADVAWALNRYGAIFADYGDLSRAMAVYRDALRLAREVRQGDDEALALEGIGRCLAGAGDAPDAAAHLGEALGIYHRLGMRPDADRVEAHLAKLRET